ncbi:MAG TPA: PEP-CTERM sorting domain-containing protein, partial [Gammaproteobacteria bacterium]|nr:PEP-CTERM sorting domain-containing protein [Gammaproteobacteria bacterium]
GSTVWTYSPDLFGDGVKSLSLNAPTPLGLDFEIIRDTGGAVGFTNTTPGLLAGNPYQLSARITTLADSARIPEPMILSLLGLGLFGLGAVRRRRFSTHS